MAVQVECLECSNPASLVAFLLVAIGEVKERPQAGIFALTSETVPKDRAEALRLLGSCFRSGYGLDLIDRDPDLDSIRDRPEFRRLVDEARARRPANGADPDAPGRGPSPAHR